MKKTTLFIDSDRVDTSKITIPTGSAPGSLQRLAQEHACVRNLMDQRDKLLEDVALLMKENLQLRQDVKILEKEVENLNGVIQTYQPKDRVVITESQWNDACSGLGSKLK